MEKAWCTSRDESQDKLKKRAERTKADWMRMHNVFSMSCRYTTGPEESLGEPVKRGDITIKTTFTFKRHWNSLSVLMIKYYSQGLPGTKKSVEWNQWNSRWNPRWAAFKVTRIIRYATETVPKVKKIKKEVNVNRTTNKYVNLTEIEQSYNPSYTNTQNRLALQVLWMYISMPVSI